MKKKLAIIGTAGVPSRYGGFETLAQQLVINLKDEYQIHVYNSTEMYAKDERAKYWNSARIHYLPFSANGWQSIIYDIISIFHALFYADYLLVLGVSGGMVLPIVRVFSRKKIIVNIDGLEWRRAKWNKWIKRFLKLSEWVAVKFSHADIADNPGIKKYSATAYQTLSHMIAYGADHVIKTDLTPELKERYSVLNSEYACAVARIEPENNVHIILQAFSKKPDSQLVYIGNWESSEYGRDLRQQYKGYPNLHMLDPIYEQKTLDAIRSNCKIYVHGHSAGGTNPSLVEAMYLGLPTIAFDVSYNKYSTHHKALYFKDSEELSSTLSIKTKSDLAIVSRDLLRIAHANYTWAVIAKQYSAIMKSFSFNYVKPSVFSFLNKRNTDWFHKNQMAHLHYRKTINEQS